MSGPKDTRGVRGMAIGCAGAVLIGMAGWAGGAGAADWPQFRGPNRDAKATDFTPPQTWPKQLAEKWKVMVGSSDASPALVGNRLYVFAREGADEITVCLEAATGKEVWRDKYAPGVSAGGPASGHPGPRGSPAVADGKVVTNGIGGTVTCLDAATGKVVWRKEAGTEVPRAVPGFMTASSPLIVDGMAIVQLGGGGGGMRGGRGGGGGGGDGGGGAQGQVFAFDLASGQAKWKANTDGTTYASPTPMTVGGVKMIAVQTDRSLVGLAVADGKQLWKVETPAAGRAYHAPSPAVEGDMVVYTGGNSGTKAFKIEKQGDGFAAKELWANTQFGTMYTTPVIKDGLVYAVASRGTVYCVSAKDGSLVWKSDGSRADQGFGTLVDAGPVIVLLNSRSELVAIKPGGTAYAEVASIRISEGQTYGFPVLAGNRVYVQDQNSVSALAFE